MASLEASLQAVDNWSNFEVYKLEKPVGLIRADVHRSPFRSNLEEVRWLMDDRSGGVREPCCSCMPSTCQGSACPPYSRCLAAQVIDAVVCDPPYGVRAGGRKSQSIPERQISDREKHISATAPYFLGQQSILHLNWSPQTGTFTSQPVVCHDSCAVQYNDHSACVCMLQCTFQIPRRDRA